MGNSFCKVNDTYITKDKRYFVSCMTDHGLGTKTSESTWAGKCMYHDETKLKTLMEKSQATKKEPTSEEQRDIYIDTGLKCNVKATENGPVATTEATSVPSGYLQAKPKSGAKPDDVAAFEARYMEFLLDAHMQNKLPQFDEQIAGLFEFKEPVKEAPPMPATTITPSQPSSTAWTPLNIALVSILALLMCASIVMVGFWFVKGMNGSTTNPSTGGKRFARRK